MTSLLIRLLVTAAALIGYLGYKAAVVAELQRLTGPSVGEPTMAVCLVVSVFLGLVWLWRDLLAKDKRFHAPLLVSAVLFVGDAGYSILESHYSPALAWLSGGLVSSYSPTLLAIGTTVLTEVLVGRFWYGKWPHLASAYVSGISAGILIKSPEAWPFVLAGMISITSKYVLRVGDRHLWNPTNFGVTMMLFLAPQSVASLSVQAGNEVWSVLVIWVLGGLILYNLGRLYLPVTFVTAFVLLSWLRALYTGHEFLTELAPMTSPMFQLYIFFMITDPKTTTKGKRSQIAVVLLVALADTAFRLLRDQHSFYHALFVVGPVANLIEIAYFAHLATPKPAPSALSEMPSSLATSGSMLERANSTGPT